MGLSDERQRTQLARPETWARQIYGLFFAGEKPARGRTLIAERLSPRDCRPAVNLVRQRFADTPTTRSRESDQARVSSRYRKSSWAANSTSL